MLGSPCLAIDLITCYVSRQHFIEYRLLLVSIITICVAYLSSLSASGKFQVDIRAKLPLSGSRRTDNIEVQTIDT